MTKYIFRESDGKIADVKNRTIAILGYGNQGRSQALNLRDSGLDVIIGNRDDEYKKRAESDGFKVHEISKAVSKADILFFLLPDELLAEIYKSSIEPSLQEGATLVFAHGYTIAYRLIKPPNNVDVIMIAPRMIGIGVRELFLTGEGFYSFVAVHQDITKTAKNTLLGLCKALGTLQRGAIEVTFEQETALDLFNEQGFGPAFGQVLLNSIYTLIDAGYPPEAVFIEMYLSGEMEYTYEKFRKIGLVKQTSLHSHTSQYGAMSRAMKYLNFPFKKVMRGILNDIESEKFAKEWEKPISKLKFKFLKFFSTRTRISRLEKKVRKSLNIPEVDIFDEIVISDNEKKSSEEIKKELEEFENFYKEY